MGENEKKVGSKVRLEEVAVLNNIYCLKYNLGLQNYNDKKQYPWHLKIVIEAKLLISNTIEKEKELKSQRDIDQKLKRALKNYCRIKELLEIIKSDSRELHWYLCSIDIDYVEIKKVVDNIKKEKYIEFFLYKDEKWSNVELYLIRAS